jgi:hypothetical protein
MQKILRMMLLGAGTLAVAMAGGATPVPEIDPSTGVAALGLLAGAALVIRGRRKK